MGCYSSKGNKYEKDQIISCRREQVAINPEEQYQRIQGRDLLKNPHSSIIAIVSRTYQGKPSYATGVLLSKNLILTAAHAIYNKQYSKINTDFKFYHQPNGVGKDYYYVDQWKYSPEFQTCPLEQKLKFDYALVRIQKQKQLHHDIYPQILVTCKNCFKKDTELKIGIFGYPFQHEDNFSLRKNGGINLYQYGFYLRNRVQQINHENFTISYKINTKGGQSGSPIIMGNDIIGIHNGGSVNANIGRLITAEMAQKLVRWGEELNGDPISIDYNKYCCCPNVSILKKQNEAKVKIFQTFQSRFQKFDSKHEIPNEIDINQINPVFEVKKVEEKHISKSLEPKKKSASKKIPSLKLQEKAIQIKQSFIYDIVEKLKTISEEDKKKTTSLTLKQEVNFGQKSVQIVIQKQQESIYERVCLILSQKYQITYKSVKILLTKGYQANYQGQKLQQLKEQQQMYKEYKPKLSKQQKDKL